MLRRLAARDSGEASRAMAVQGETYLASALLISSSALHSPDKGTRKREGQERERKRRKQDMHDLLKLTSVAINEAQAKAPSAAAAFVHATAVLARP